MFENLSFTTRKVRNVISIFPRFMCGFIDRLPPSILILDNAFVDLMMQKYFEGHVMMKFCLNEVERKLYFGNRVANTYWNQCVCNRTLARLLPSIAADQYCIAVKIHNIQIGSTTSEVRDRTQKIVHLSRTPKSQIFRTRCRS